MLKKMIATSVVALTAFSANADSNFAGFYAGVHAGYGVGSVKVEEKNAAGALIGAASKMHTNGFVGGIFAGYTHQMGGLLVGAEASVNFGDVKTAESINTIVGATNAKRKAGIGLAVRAGIDLNSWMPYVKLGWEYGNFKGLPNDVPVHILLSSSEISNSQNHNAFVAGLGVETVVAENVIVGMEYSISFYQKKKILTITGAVNSTTDLKPCIHDVKVRLGYKF